MDCNEVHTTLSGSSAQQQRFDIQTAFWGYSACLLADRMTASIVIQSAWRGFQFYIDYIFTMTDIMIVQRTVRQWIAKKTVATIREARYLAMENAVATDIQKIWTGCCAHMAMLFNLVHIIVAQVSQHKFLCSLSNLLLLKPNFLNCLLVALHLAECGTSVPSNCQV